MTDTFICIAPNYWGRGKTAEEAKRNCQRHAGGKIGQHAIYASTDSEMHVNEFGDVLAAKGSNLREVSRS